MLKNALQEYIALIEDDTTEVVNLGGRVILDGLRTRSLVESLNVSHSLRVLGCVMPLFDR